MSSAAGSRCCAPRSCCSFYALIRGNEEGWGSALIISCFAACALLLVLFVVVERRAADPLLDLSLFRKPAFTGVTITGFALSASIFSMVHERARAVASGGTGHALQAVPPADRDAVVHAAHHAFVTGFNTIAMVSVVVAAVGTLAGYALVRSRDFVGAAGPASAPPEPEPAPARA